MALEFALSFEGASADNNLLDFYDAAAAFSAFQRTLALTAHLVINGEIITQAPALKGAQILSYPIEPGSWKAVAVVAGTLMLSGAVASRDSVLGHIFTSAYDYVLNEALGFHVDFNKALGEQLEEYRRQTDVIPKGLDEGKIQALIEKNENSLKDLHRPISQSRTAETGTIGLSQGGKITRKTGPTLNIETYEYINVTRLSDRPIHRTGKVSSYNTNTFKGRIYVEEEGRPVPFTLSETSRTPRNISKIVRSLSSNAIDRFDSQAEIEFEALTFESKNGRLKSYLIISIK
ncbi:hypothetical protein SAMN02982989_4015 [Xaviernesmea oryzae]|uniref:Uncharacterized protein n=1 Tax=Xaviernesmea oryzae TaxID=464029 RepID=A0A1X7GL46_9HYPH|nr:hypothetical protein [Xaviernesmea oryzae]SMF71361.1 hypothetical protein SAMN02982989_4015 [Xaviernesmea oryzae]